MNDKLFACKRRASDVGAAEMVVAAVTGLRAHTVLCQVTAGATGALELAVNTTLTTSWGTGMIDVAGTIGDLVLTYTKRPSDIYFDLFVIEDFFDTDVSDYGITLSKVVSRIQRVESALKILLENRRLWAMVSDHLLSTGAITVDDVKTYQASCSGGGGEGLSSILALSIKDAF